MTNRSPDEDSSESWLRQQWNNLRHGRWRDVILVRVEEGASNVAVGKYILQVNVGGRNLALPLIWIALAMVVVVTVLLYPIVKPLVNPAKMQGGALRVAIADFGEANAQGAVRASAQGSLLSAWVYDELQRTIDAEPDNSFLRGINVWHNTRLDTPRDIRLRVVQDEKAAAKLAHRIAAQMVIYGNVVATPDGEALDLQFYVAPTLPDESNLLFGQHVLGRPLALPLGTGDDPTANLVVIEGLQARTRALAAIMAGLTQQALGRTEQALATFRQAEQALAHVPDEAGKDILYFLIGREEFFLDHVDEAEAAFQHAVAITDTYARGQAALGSVYYARAQALSPEERLAPPHYLDMAAARQQLAVELARTQENALVEAIARVALAKTYRLQGETAYQQRDFDTARGYFAQVAEEATQAQPVLEDMRQFRILAQAYETQGAAFLQEADILRRAGATDAARATLEQARGAYEQCIVQGQIDQIDQLLDEQIVDEFCRRHLETVDQLEQRLEAQG
jgi:tetratricopeptide (TPR) repeat protein